MPRSPPCLLEAGAGESLVFARIAYSSLVFLRFGKPAVGLLFANLSNP